MGNNTEDILLVSEIVVLGNKNAFERLVDKYQVAVRNFFLLHTGYDEMVSDDLSQETFIRCWERLGTFKGLSSFRTWMYSVAFNILSDYYRSRKRQIQLNEYISEKNENSGVEDRGVDNKHDVISALKSLSDMEKSCIILYYMHDLSVSKISSIVNLPSGTVKSHLSRARLKMQKYLKNDGYEE